MGESERASSCWGSNLESLSWTDTALTTKLLPLDKPSGTECSPFVPHIVYVYTIQWGTFKGENFRELVKNMIFLEKTFTDCSLLPCQRTPRPKFCRGKLLCIATKPQNLRNFSPSKVSRYTVAEARVYNIRIQSIFVQSVNCVQRS